jgi:hypothetical protein
VTASCGHVRLPFRDRPDPHASAEERYDAQAAFQRTGLPDFIPELQAVIDFINGQHEDAALAKGGHFPAFSPPMGANGGARSVLLDQFQVGAWGDYWDRPGLLGFEGMKAMVEQTPTAGPSSPSSAVSSTRWRSASGCRS